MKSGATSDQQTYNQLRLHLYFDPAMQHTNMDQEYSLVLTWAASSGTAATAETGRTGTRAVYSTWPTCCPHRAWGGAVVGEVRVVVRVMVRMVRVGMPLRGRAVPAAARPSSRPGAAAWWDAGSTSPTPGISRRFYGWSVSGGREGSFPGLLLPIKKIFKWSTKQEGVEDVS